MRNDEGTRAATYLGLQINDLTDDCDLFGLAVINHKFAVIALGLGLHDLLDRHGQQPALANSLLDSCTRK